MIAFKQQILSFSKRPFSVGPKFQWGLCALLLVCGCSAHAQQFSEPQLRASVIVAVLRYANWIDTPPANTLTVCGVGNSPGFNVLKQFGSTITVSNRVLAFSDLDSDSDRKSDSCAVVVVGADVNKRQHVAAINIKSLLTICDDCNHSDQYAVSLYVKAQRIRFSVDIARARSANVQFSAAMMELADRIEHP